jgi:glycosyltransferase involved in cell wall biosynthesis
MMMKCSILISTYGEKSWQDLAMERAYPSCISQGAHEVLVLHEADGTVSSCRNKNALRATGDFLIHVDADDEIAPDYVGAMRRAFEQEETNGNLLLTPAVQQIRKGRPAKPFFFDRGISLRDDNWLVVGTLIAKDLFMEVGGFGEYPHGFEDFSLWSKCFRIGAKVVKVPEAVYVYYHNPLSKHKQGWRDRKWQVATHQRVVRELDEWEALHA